MTIYGKTQINQNEQQSLDIPPCPEINFDLIPQIPQSSSSRQRVFHFVGLRNQGSTCYLDSLIQSLFMTPEFRYHLFKWRYEASLHGEMTYCIPFQLQKLFARLQEHLRDVEETTDLTKSFQWEYHQLIVQHDIEELCRVLFEAIELSLGENDVNFINDLYLGTTKSVIRCLECENKSTRDDAFLDLSLPIQSIFESIKNKSLEMAFMNYLKHEKLEGDNQYNCTHCNKKTNALKYFTFEKLPKILFIQLGRFYYDYNTEARKKINDRVHFPLLLNMNKFKKDYEMMEYNELESESDDSCLNFNEETVKSYLAQGPFVYELFSIVIHSGTANGGHYYSYIKSFTDGKWYNFDDSNVYELNMSDICKTYGLANTTGYLSAETGYCLMYRRIDPLETKLALTDLVIDEHLSSLLKEENEKIIAVEKEKKEKLNKISLNVFYNNKRERIDTMKNIQIKLVKKAILVQFELDISMSHEYRLREYDSVNMKALDYFLIEDITLEEAFISGYKAYTLQHWDEQTKEFPIYDPNVIQLNVYHWSEENSQCEFDMYPFKSMSISNRATLKEMIFQICSLYGIDNDKKFFLSKKVEFGVNNNIFEITEDDLTKNQELFLSAILNRMQIFIEEISDDESKAFIDSHFMKLFKASQEKIKIVYNLPLKDKSEKLIFDREIALSKLDSLREIKEKICSVLAIDPNEVIMKKNGPAEGELLEVNDQLFSIAKESPCRLYFEYGNPLKPNELLVKLCLCRTSYEKFSVFPYQMTDIIVLKVNEELTIKELKPIFIEEAKKALPNLELDIKYCLIREFASGKPTKILCDEHKLGQYNYYQNVKLLLQEYKAEELHSKPHDVEISLRFFNTEKWTITDPVEILLNQQESVQMLITKIMAFYPEIEQDNIQIFKIANGYSTYLNNLLTNTYTNLSEYLDGRIDQYPFFIKNDGYMLIVRDKSIGIGEASDEVKAWGFLKEPEIPSIPRCPSFDQLPGQSKRVKSMIEKFEKGEFDIVTHSSKTNEDKKANRVKEKGIVIKVKKLQAEEEALETFKETTAEPGVQFTKAKKEKEDIKSSTNPSSKKASDKQNEESEPFEGEIEPLI